MRALLLTTCFLSLSASASCPPLTGLYQCTGQTKRSWVTGQTKYTRFEYKTIGSEVRYIIRSGPNDERMEMLLPFQTGRWRANEAHRDLRDLFDEMWISFNTRAICSPSGELRLEAKVGDPSDRSGIITVVTPLQGSRIRIESTITQDITRPNPSTDQFSRIECAPDLGGGRAG